MERRGAVFEHEPLVLAGGVSHSLPVPMMHVALLTNRCFRLFLTYLKNVLTSSTTLLIQKCLRTLYHFIELNDIFGEATCFDPKIAHYIKSQ